MRAHPVVFLAMRAVPKLLLAGSYLWWNLIRDRMFFDGEKEGVTKGAPRQYFVCLEGEGVYNGV